jgi:hypothetical protein
MSYVAVPGGSLRWRPRENIWPVPFATTHILEAVIAVREAFDPQPWPAFRSSNSRVYLWEGLKQPAELGGLGGRLRSVATMSPGARPVRLARYTARDDVCPAIRPARIRIAPFVYPEDGHSCGTPAWEQQLEDIVERYQAVTDRVREHDGLPPVDWSTGKLIEDQPGQDGEASLT